MPPHIQSGAAAARCPIGSTLPEGQRQCNRNWSICGCRSKGDGRRNGTSEPHESNGSFAVIAQSAEPVETRNRILFLFYGEIIPMSLAISTTAFIATLGVNTHFDF